MQNICSYDQFQWVNNISITKWRLIYFMISRKLKFSYLVFNLRCIIAINHGVCLFLAYHEKLMQNIPSYNYVILIKLCFFLNMVQPSDLPCVADGTEHAGLGPAAPAAAAGLWRHAGAVHGDCGALAKGRVRAERTLDPAKQGAAPPARRAHARAGTELQRRRGAHDCHSSEFCHHPQIKWSATNSEKKGGSLLETRKRVPLTQWIWRVKGEEWVILTKVFLQFM